MKNIEKQMKTHTELGKENWDYKVLGMGSISCRQLRASISKAAQRFEPAPARSNCHQALFWKGLGLRGCCDVVKKQWLLATKSFPVLGIVPPKPILH